MNLHLLFVDLVATGGTGAVESLFWSTLAILAGVSPLPTPVLARLLRVDMSVLAMQRANLILGKCRQTSHDLTLKVH